MTRLRDYRLLTVAGAVWMALVAGCGSANWLRNGFLDPGQVGQFSEPRRNEIRHTLSILEEPPGIQSAEEPRPEDLTPVAEENPIGAGDVILVTVFELLQPGTPAMNQMRVGNSGFETLPLVGPVRVTGLTPRGLELELKEKLREVGILHDADVQVAVLQSQAAQFSVVGTVVRPGVYPLLSADYRLLSALAVAGGIPPYVEKVYVFQRAGQSPQGGAQPLPEQQGPPQEGEQVGYALSDFSGGSVWSGRSDPRHGGPTTERAGRQEGPASSPTEGQPEIEWDWDDERGDWVISEAQSQPTSVEAREREEGATSAATTEPAAAPEGPMSGPEQTEEGGEPGEVAPELAAPVRIVEIPVKPLMEGDPRYNIVIHPADLINVPPGNVGEFYMMGNVARPGAYTLTGRRMTVKEAVASAGGFGPLAWPARADLIRRVTEDEEQIIQLDLDAIFAGDAPDFYLRPSDIVNVGTTPASVFFAVLRNSFRFTYGMGFVYDRNFADGDTFGAREQLKARRQAERQARGLPL